MKEEKDLVICDQAHHGCNPKFCSHVFPHMFKGKTYCGKVKCGESGLVCVCIPVVGDWDK